MLAALSLATLMAVGVPEAAAPPQADLTRAAVDDVMSQARLDFEARYSELGLLGAAPLPGEPARDLARERAARSAARAAKARTQQSADPAAEHRAQEHKGQTR